MRHATEVPTASRVGRHSLNQWLAPEETVTVQHIPALTHQIAVAEVKRAVEVAQVKVPEAAENGEGVVHKS
jgi:hypothetical protein